jgi:hypothetical protein
MQELRSALLVGLGVMDEPMDDDWWTQDQYCVECGAQTYGSRPCRCDEIGDPGDD